MAGTQPGREITREGRGTPRLVVYTPGAEARAWPVETTELVIGRGAGAELRLADPRASEAHARLTRNARTGAVSLADLGSRNGTLVDGRRVASASLEDGGVVRIGDTLLVFEASLGLAPPPEAGAETSVAARVLASDAARAAASRLPVLLTGPTGAGKGHLARRIAGDAEPFVHVNCAAIPAELFEAEVFGHTRGAFTGATSERAGLLEVAHGGVLFLDELGALAPAHQAKLLTVLDDGVMRRVGSSRDVVVDVRVLAAMNDDPGEAVRSGRLRRDLFYRLSALRIEVPPLRRRRADIVPLLVQAGAIETSADLTAEALEALLVHDWPGNIRELVAVAATVAASPRPVDYHVLPGAITRFLGAEERGGVGDRPSAKAPPKATIERTLADADGNVSEAARRLGKHRNQLVRWLRAYGIDPG